MADPALKQDTTLFDVQRSATGRFWTLASVDEALVRRLQPKTSGFTCRIAWKRGMVLRPKLFDT